MVVDFLFGNCVDFGKREFEAVLTGRDTEIGIKS